MRREQQGGRCASVETTGTAKFGKPSKSCKPQSILPKVSLWTDARRHYRENWLALRLSLRVLKPNVQPFSEKHKAIYEQICLENDSCYSRLIWNIWEQGKSHYEG